MLFSGSLRGMMVYSESTPCPAHKNSNHHSPSIHHPPLQLPQPDRQGGESTTPGDTGFVDVTTQLRAALRHAAPRRRRGTNIIRVHEDNKETENDGRPHTGQTAERFDTMSFASAGPTLHRRPSRKETDQHATATLRKSPPRRTQCLPKRDAPNDAVLRMMQHGRMSTSKDIPAKAHNPVEGRVPRSPRLSLPAYSTAAPKRAPLQPALQAVQEHCSSFDRPGRGFGKENVPPGKVVECLGQREGYKVTAVNECAGTQRTEAHSMARTCSVPTTKVHKTFAEGSSLKIAQHSKRHAGSISHKLSSQVSVCGAETNGGYQPVEGHTASSIRGLRGHESTKLIATTKKRPSMFIGSLKVQSSTHQCQQYALLQEEIFNPEMFEDDWLSNQELALTQLVNRLFKAYEEPRSVLDPRALRQVFMALYQEHSMLTLFQRIQASLLYGALSLPKETSWESHRLMTDLGIRQKFVHLWTHNYDPYVLRAAVEVVTCRELPSPSITAAAYNGDNNRANHFRGDLDGLVQACLFCNEDGPWPRNSSSKYADKACGRTAPSADFSVSSWRWRRTVQRSLMLIALLDNAKELKVITLSLFRRSSVLKSSSSIVTELAALLMPSGGDILRPLAHLGFEVRHVQFPLAKYDYTIRNLATDMRDGVRLARLVELLLYHPPANLIHHAEDITTTMPSGEVLTASDGVQYSSVLSQHLKYPCLGRATKISNVQISLSTLKEVPGFAQIEKELRPEDVVDGHRGKTIVLLYFLVGRLGLEALIDSKDLRKEIYGIRSGNKGHSNGSSGKKQDQEILGDKETPTHLLKAWAQAIAHTHGLGVLNLSTSFDNGVVFVKIIEEYYRYLASPSFLNQDRIVAEDSLEGRLRNIGCSASFGESSCSAVLLRLSQSLRAQQLQSSVVQPTTVNFLTVTLPWRRLHFYLLDCWVLQRRVEP